MRGGVQSHTHSPFLRILLEGLDCVHVLANFQRGPKSQLQGHEEVMILYQTQRLPVYFVLDESIQVRLIPERGEKITDVVDGP